MLSQEKNAGILTVSPRKINGIVKEAEKAKLHIKSGCAVEKGDKEITLSELLEEEEEEEEEGEKRKVGD